MHQRFEPDTLERKVLPFPAPVAQLDRASGYEPEGREFESLRAHHFPLYLPLLVSVEVF